MELAELGFEKWFQEKCEGIDQRTFGVARVTRVDRDRYLVRNEADEVHAEPTGRLVFSAESSQDLPCVGDWVIVQYHNEGELAIIHDVLPRRTFLRRKSAGNKVEYQLVAANVDVAFIMQSCDLDFNLRRLERYLVMVNEGHVEPVILLSKSDLVSQEELRRRTTEIRQVQISARIIAFSNTTEIGLNTVRQALQKRKTYCRPSCVA
jgi:ribosome biogenesis GTPase / thiamine phosphate phosphatase